MDIKSRSKLKFIGWMMLLTIGLSGTLLGLNRGNEYVGKSYFQTPQFDEQLNQYFNFLSIFELIPATKEEAKKNISVTQEEIKEHRYRYGDLSQQISNIKEQYRDKIEDAKDKQNDEVAKVYTEERDQKIKDITKNFKNDEHVRLKVIKEKEEKIDKYYEGLERYRPEYERYSQSFKYYLKDNKTGSIYTNLNLSKSSVEELKKEMLFVVDYGVERDRLSNNGFLDDYTNSYGEVRDSIVKKRGYLQGWIGVSNESTSGIVSNSIQEFEQTQLRFYLYTSIGIISLLCAMYLARSSFSSQFSISDNIKSFYNLIPLEIKVLLFLITDFIAYGGLMALGNKVIYVYSDLYWHIRTSVYILFGTTLFVAIILIQLYLLNDRIRDLKLLKEDLQQSLFWRIKDAFLIRSIGFKVMLLLGIIFAAGIGFTVVLMQARAIVIYLPLFIAVVIPTLILLASSIGYLNKIINHTKELAKGNLEPDLPVRGKSVLANFAENVNTLKHGVKVSISEQAKSERLKTELITNVSHDLRTPLTSIINYTELLKTPNLSKEDQEAYIQIIDRKSKRLKVLIDDLFEASKMVSGTIELVKEKVDLVQLLQQSLAEHSEAITESGLQLRVNKPEGPVYAIVDGQKMWRVYDNLIGNILKYSLENTRVYISVKALQDKALISFKNVTKYELGENTDELFERFKRGDTSRNTEGSGLGLAIAKSIVDLHGGSLDIEVDGDLFKVTVTL